jgi:hypothetical protein
MHEEKRPWWREPMVWLVGGLPLTAVIAGLTTVWIASRNADDLVKEGYVKEGMTVGQIQESDRVAENLGLVAEASVVEGRIRLAISSTQANRIMPAMILLTLAHPTDALQDSAVVLKHAGDGLYLGPAPSLPAGKRHVLLESAEQGWRLKGIWEAPFTATLTMKPPRTEP